MIFEKGQLYHIFNQGNNRQELFLCRENYLFFLQKIRTHILPYCDVLAYCLMPNHFHLMVLVNEVMLPKSLDNSKVTQKSLNNSIAIMLRSYTRAINKQQKSSGSLFRQKTKAICLTVSKGVTPSFYNTKSGTVCNNSIPEKQYPQNCFDYIHQNPVKAKMVKKASDWEFSSAKDYAEQRDDGLINRKLAKQYIQV